MLTHIFSTYMLGTSLKATGPEGIVKFEPM